MNTEVTVRVIIRRILSCDNVQEDRMNYDVINRWDCSKKKKMATIRMMI